MTNKLLAKSNSCVGLVHVLVVSESVVGWIVRIWFDGSLSYDVVCHICNEASNHVQNYNTVL